ncbi:alpha/beta fold hydrolase, partial [Halomonas kenyensis]|nr:alpha/beta fold hydrolase [Halomonas kenyensis]
MSTLCIEAWGSGTPVLLIHGSLATGQEEWEAQQPLAEEGYRLLALDRRGYGQSPAAKGEDFLQDADDVVELKGDGVHLVGHSYGGMAAMFAAARRPEATLSLALFEPPAFSLAQHDRAARALVSRIQEMWDLDLSDGEWGKRFLRAVGTEPEALPPELLEQIVPLVPLLRHGRTLFWSSQSGHIFKPQLPIQSPSASGSPGSSGAGSCCTPSRC